MKRLLFLLLILGACTTMIHAQNFPRVRLFFYLDATQSMETNGLWNESKENLIKAIESIEDTSTEVTICVFSDFEDKNTRLASTTYSRFETISKSANDDGKKELVDFVRGLTSPTDYKPSWSRQTLTNLERPWNHFVLKAREQTGEDFINAMILITDGGHEEGRFPKTNFFHKVENWSIDTKPNCYGWVVELKDDVNTSEKRSKERMDNLIDSQIAHGHLKRLNTHDFNFKFLSIAHHPDTINIRNGNSVFIKISTNTNSARKFLKNIDFSCTPSTIKIKSRVVSDRLIQLTLEGLDTNKLEKVTPVVISGRIPTHFENNNLVSLLKEYSCFKLICLNRFSRAINIDIIDKNKPIEVVFNNLENLGSIDYYEPWKLFGNTISKDSIMPAHFQLHFRLNSDAINRNSSARLVFVDNSNKPFDKNAITITDSKNNSIDTIFIKDISYNGEYTITFNPEIFKEKSIFGYIRLENNQSLDSACGLQLKEGGSYNIMSWQVDIDCHLNPSLVIFWKVLFLLLLFLLAAIALYGLMWLLGPKFPWNWDIKFESNINNNPTITFDCGGKDYRFNGFRIFTHNANTFYARRLYMFRVNKIVLCNETKRVWNYWTGHSIYIKSKLNTVSNQPKINKIIISPKKGKLADIKIFYGDNTKDLASLVHFKCSNQTKGITIKDRNVDIFGKKHHN